ncbi:hypothetical protein QFZ79_002924 [Arthrobacter sp. V4I6]|uniref:hypothetical protein n=1 Tax=Arthrobacter sp. V4I6 TaxID=3042281 RepID=UPI002780E52F|nr:hypothetical protein [Arthrobacter sp. V4I6]MDQ0854813.1 hypothetical protein [Arthrobacter sp. V4I6]
MRIRSIKPEFYRSADISSLEWESRFLFIALWSYVDDNGVGVDKLSNITADLFADDLEQDSSETFARVSRGLQKLSEAGRIVRYEVRGKKYLYIANWLKHQRIDKPNKERYPRPGAESSVIPETPAEPSRHSPEGPATGTEEQGNRGTEDLKTCPIGPDEFFDWYLHYPRKESRAAAEKAYVKARAQASSETLVEGAKRYATDPNREKQFTKLPATWLNGGCWDDDPLPSRSPAGRTTGDKMRTTIERARAAQDRMNQQGPTQLQIGA